MYPEAWHVYWGGKPLCPIHKHHLNSLNINITTHLVQQMGRNSVNRLKFEGMHGSVCVYVCKSSFKDQTV